MIESENDKITKNKEAKVGFEMPRIESQGWSAANVREIPIPYHSSSFDLAGLFYVWQEMKKNTDQPTTSRDDNQN